MTQPAWRASTHEANPNTSALLSHPYYWSTYRNRTAPQVPLNALQKGYALVKNQPKDLQLQIVRLSERVQGLEQELRLQQLKLSESESRFRHLAELSADWYWETDNEFRFTILSGGASDLDRQKIREHLGKTRWALNNASDDVDLWRAHRAQLERHEPFRNFEYERVDEDGETVCLSISGEPVFDGLGQFVGYRGVGSKITDRKRAEQALRSSERRFRTVVNALAEGVVLLDAEGRIVDCNPSAERIFGRPLEKLKNSRHLAPDWTMLREDGGELLEHEYPGNIARASGQAQLNKIVCYQKPFGSILWTLLNIQPLLDEDGRHAGLVLSVSDISSRKKAELEIVRLNVDLEKRVASRTEQLENANKELEAFSYSVAHDLRSPLNTIDGFSVLLEKTISSEMREQTAHYMDRIRKGVRRMAELTDGLLLLAQLSRTNLRWQQVDVAMEASGVLALLGEVDPHRKVRFTVEPGLKAVADATLLRQVLDNLIGNAWKFTMKKETAEISVGSLMDDRMQKVFFVRDNGAGFNMAYARKLFGTFERLHKVDEFPGSGIGLATVGRIINRHGGRIWAEATEGIGATFFFTLGHPPLLANTADGIGEEGAPILLKGKLNPEEAGSHLQTIRAASAFGNDAGAVSFTYAFEFSAVGMALIGLDGIGMRVNPAFCEMLGYSEAEMLSRTIYDLTHSDDVAHDIRLRSRMVAGELETYQREKRYIHKSGRVVWGYLTSSLARDDNRKPLYFIVQVQDITEQKRTEQGLRESESRFRALTAMSSDFFWEQDASFRFIDAAGLIEVGAVPRADIIGKCRWELPNVDMDESVWAAHRAQLECHEPFKDFVITRADPNGDRRYITISGIPIFDATGNFTGYRGTGLDITEARRVANALRSSEKLLREITDAVPALMAYIGADERCRFHNRAYTEAFGLTSDQILGKDLREILDAQIYESVRPRIKEVLTGHPVTYERQQKSPQGDYRHYAFNYVPRYGEDEEEGHVVGFYVLAHDITEFKRLDQMKSEFVSTVSHELRTPLTSIRGSLGLISGGVAGQLPEAAKSLVTIAHKNCERLIRLINDILDIEKLESGLMRMELQPVQLHVVLSHALSANESYGAARGVKLSLHCCTDPVRVQADPDRLTQVVTNLLSNAVKFSPDGETVEVHVIRSSDRIRVEVRDRGPGIPDEFRNRIFQKFSQADSSSAREKTGTGLGLNISRAIVERLGGSIGFDSQTGIGSTFFFELPVMADIEQDVAASTVPALAPRVLVCDGDRDVAKLISMLLDKAGLDADIAHTAKEAWALLETTRYASITVDPRLPGQEAGGFINALRNKERTRSLPVVVISGLADDGKLELDHTPSSVTDWLTKPIDESRLVACMRRAVDELKGEKPRILHVEDDLDIQHITESMAEEFATFSFATNLAQARAHLRERTFDLVLLDLSLGTESGWDLVKTIDALKPRPSLIVFSASEVVAPKGTRADAVLLKASSGTPELLNAIQKVLGISTSLASAAKVDRT